MHAVSILKLCKKPHLQTALARTLQTSLAPPAAVQTSAASQTELLLAQVKLEGLKIAAAAEERKAAVEERKLAAAAEEHKLAAADDERRFAAEERRLAAEAEQRKISALLN